MPPQDRQEEPLKRMAKIVQALINHPDSGPFRDPVDWRGLELFDYPEVVKRMIDLGTIARKLERNQYATAWECALDVRLVWKNCMSYNAEGSDFWLLAKSLARKFEDRFRRLRQEFDVGEVAEERPDSRGGGDSAGESEGESDGDDSEGDDHDDDNEEDEEEYGDGDDDNDPRASSRSSNGHRLSTASAMSSNGSVTSNNGGTSSSPSGPASLDARAQLAANLLLLQGTELGHIIMTLERECPAALEVNDAPGRRQQQKQHDVSVNSNGNKTTTSSSNNRSVPEKLEIVLDVLEGPLFTKIATYASEKATIRKRGMMAAAAAAGGSAAATINSGDHITINDISNKRRRRK